MVERFTARRVSNSTHNRSSQRQVLRGSQFNGNDSWSQNNRETKHTNIEEIDLTHTTTCCCAVTYFIYKPYHCYSHVNYKKRLLQCIRFAQCRTMNM